jgi:putative ABC transport system substrate-binding protein
MIRSGDRGGTLRFAVAAALGLQFLFAPLVAAQPAKLPRVGLLGLGSAEGSPLFEALRQGLRDHGWVEGQTVTFVDRSAVDDYTRLPATAAQLIRLKVDVIVAAGTTATEAARKATGTVPIVTVVASDPVETGLATSLARPGANITGLTSSGRDLLAKRLELLKETLPGISRIAVLWSPDARTGVGSLRAVEAAAGALALQVQSVGVRRAEDLDKAFRSMSQDRSGAVVTVSSSLFRAHRARVVELTAKYRLPSTFPEKEFVEAGGLMSYGPELKASYRQLAGHVDKILKGAKPGDLPFEQPTSFVLVIDLRTARSLGLRIPQSVLARADQIIQ